ncbi:hypothetical protein [Caldicellulosiruptor morganii]|uniref:DUF4258 domain-containing protein n=1 Tax=Caldicellulosiruptor morganii TaxID=1387555 RepID=A0ABY7BN85_9FIRM|nr:hypothetical protein [Caldicellulosiruptor morganii]WAM33347.1 hypothetical protein OTK00_001842 [Caldicellulosiruptor morganii]
MNIRITRHAIERYQERIERCSDDEAMNMILKTVYLGKVIAKRKRGAYTEKAIRYNDAIAITYEYEGGVIVVSVIKNEYERCWWKRQNRL